MTVGTGPREGWANRETYSLPSENETMSRELVVFGTGTLAEVATFYFEHDSPYEVVAFTADAEYIESETFLNRPVVPFESVADFYPPSDYGMFVAIGYRDVNHLRAEKFEAAKRKGFKLVSYVNSTVTEWGETNVGENCFIFEDQTIQPFVDIGDNVIIWSGNHIGHHSTIGDHCFVTSHAVISGYVKIEPYAFIGVNATLRDEISIGESCIVGAGATVVSDTEPESVYVGESATLYAEDSSKVGL